MLPPEFGTVGEETTRVPVTATEGAVAVWGTRQRSVQGCHQKHDQRADGSQKVSTHKLELSRYGGR